MNAASMQRLSLSPLMFKAVLPRNTEESDELFQKQKAATQRRRTKPERPAYEKTVSDF